MIFLDTSAIYAWTDSKDPKLVTHNDVLLESLSLIHARLGLSTDRPNIMARRSPCLILPMTQNGSC